MLYSEEEAQEKWQKIPTDTDVLITHGPPYGIFALKQIAYYILFKGILDKLYREPKRVGCKVLAKEVKERVKPLYHVFGHIHEEYGQTKIEGTTYINASTCNFKYIPLNTPIVFELPKRQQKN